jgi:hypothetical protein
MSTSWRVEDVAMLSRRTTSSVALHADSGFESLPEVSLLYSAAWSVRHVASG